MWFIMSEIESMVLAAVSIYTAIEIGNHSHRTAGEVGKRLEIEMRSMRDYVKSMLITMNRVCVFWSLQGVQCTAFCIHMLSQSNWAWPFKKVRQMYHLINVNWIYNLIFGDGAAAACASSSIASLKSMNAF